ncbi:hypothetical protein GF377_05460 [candidate division GN15 bacterium]|nr:hypothetical protein [candidate division GN15 bacterium]
MMTEHKLQIESAAQSCAKSRETNRWLLLLAALSCVTLFGLAILLSGCGGDEAAHTDAADQSHATTDDHSEPADAGNDDYDVDFSEDDSLMALLEGEDEKVIDEIMANLEILDYEPSEDEMYGEDVGSGMSEEDSIEAAKWIESEEKRLGEWESKLEEREKELAVLDKKVSQKILRIEQAESARIAQLARLYDGMDARAVAKLAANLDDATVVSILPRMKPKNASLVLQLMPAKRAARLSKQMITIAEN